MIVAVLMFSPSDKWIVDLRAFKDFQQMVSVLR